MSEVNEQTQEKINRYMDKVSEVNKKTIGFMDKQREYDRDLTNCLQPSVKREILILDLLDAEHGSEGMMPC
jgi:hypothetical protein